MSDKVDRYFRIAIAAGFIVFLFVYPFGNNPSVHETAIGSASLFISLLFLTFGRGVRASNIGMAFMVIGMILLLIG